MTVCSRASNNAEVSHTFNETLCVRRAAVVKKIIGDIEFFDGQVCETGQLADEAGQVGGCWLW